MKAFLGVLVFAGAAFLCSNAMADDLIADCPLVAESVPRASIAAEDLTDYSCESTSKGEMCTTMVASCQGSTSLPVAAN